MKDPKFFLKHILDETRYLSSVSSEVDFGMFLRNETLTRSFVRSLEVIGEAAKNLPSDFRRKHPQVRWKDMAGLRDILIHQYFGIDYRSVWDVVKNKIPLLREQILAILHKMDTEGQG